MVPGASRRCGPSGSPSAAAREPCRRPERRILMSVPRRSTILTGCVTRRAVLQAALAAPMLNLGRFRLFPGQRTEYSARCLSLMQETTVVDGLAVLTIGGKWQEWARAPETDRKSTRLNSSHSQISYAVFCLKKNMTRHLASDDARTQ